MGLKGVDAQYAKDAQRIGWHYRSWLVMWSCWRRTFTAFSCSSIALVIDAPTPEELCKALEQSEMRMSGSGVQMKCSTGWFPVTSVTAQAAQAVALPIRQF